MATWRKCGIGPGYWCSTFTSLLTNNDMFCISEPGPHDEKLPLSTLPFNSIAMRRFSDNPDWKLFAKKGYNPISLIAIDLRVLITAL